VLERPLRILAIVLSLLVAAGFTLFAIDDFGRASNESRDRIAGNARPDPTPRAERTREERNSAPRELVDDANDLLLRPFSGLVAGDRSRWVQRGVPALLGLLVYGFGLGYLARFARGHGGASPRDIRRQASRA
jgi:hypothetical protein